MKLANTIEPYSSISAYLYSLKKMDTLATTFIHRSIFEFVTSYGDIAQTASLQLKLFYLCCINKTTLIGSMINISLYFGKSHQMKVHCMSFLTEYISFFQFFFPLLPCADVSSTNWLKFYSVNSSHAWTRMIWQ